LYQGHRKHYSLKSEFWLSSVLIFFSEVGQAFSFRGRWFLDYFLAHSLRILTQSFRLIEEREFKCRLRRLERLHE